MARIKQVVSLLICCAVLTALAPRLISYAAENYIVNVNGVTAVWDRIGPFMRDGRLMVPLGGFGRALGAEIKWEESKKEAFIFWHGQYAWVQADNPTLYFGTYIPGSDGGNPLLTDVSPLELPARPALLQNRMAVPLAALAESLGGEIEWNEAAKTANVTVPVPQNTEEAVLMPQTQSFGGQAGLDRESFFKLLTAEEVILRYENDDPFALISFDNSLPSSAMYEVLKAAADLRVKVYGLDMNKQDAEEALPFAESSGEVVVYFINGHERVNASADPDYYLAVDELVKYMNED